MFADKISERKWGLKSPYEPWKLHSVEKKSEDVRDYIQSTTKHNLVKQAVADDVQFF